MQYNIRIILEILSSCKLRGAVFFNNNNNHNYSSLSLQQKQLNINSVGVSSGINDSLHSIGSTTTTTTTNQKLVIILASEEIG